MVEGKKAVAAEEEAVQEWYVRAAADPSLSLCLELHQ